MSTFTLVQISALIQPFGWFVRSNSIRCPAPKGVAKQCHSLLSHRTSSIHSWLSQHCDLFLIKLPSVQLSAAHLRSTECTGSIHLPAVDQIILEECNLLLVKLQSWLLGCNTQTDLANNVGMTKTFNKYVYVITVALIS